MKAVDVAKYFITINGQKNSDDEGNNLSKLKLQKLLYYAQGYYLALYNKALFLTFGLFEHLYKSIHKVWRVKAVNWVGNRDDVKVVWTWVRTFFIAFIVEGEYRGFNISFIKFSFYKFRYPFCISCAAKTVDYSLHFHSPSS